MSRDRLLLILEGISLAAALAAFTSTETYTSWVTLGLAMLAVAVALRVMRSGHLVPSTGMEAPAVLFLLSAAIATWAAYDRSTALLQLYRLLAAAVIFYAVIDSTIPTIRQGAEQAAAQRDFTPLRWVSAGLVAAAAFLALYWPTQHDFSLGTAKFAWLNELGVQMASALPHIPGPGVHSNVAAGVLGLALPFAFFLALELWGMRKRLLAGLIGIMGLIIFIGLLVTGSRGAWMGVMAAVGVGLLAAVQRRWFAGRRQMGWFWGLAVLAGAALLLFLSYSGGIERLLGQIPDPSGALQSRTSLWRQGLPLIGDTLFTGAGLMTYFYIYPVYGLFTHLPLLAHIHNFPLQIFYAQGILGLVAALWAGFVVLTWAWRALAAPPRHSGQVTLLGWAGLAALLGVAVHGMVDVVFYVERTLPLLGLAAGAAYLAPDRIIVKEESRKPRTRSVWIGAAALIFAAALALVFHRQIISQAYLNAGAVLQARRELRVYAGTDFTRQTLDEVRRTVYLDSAIQAYQAALRWNPNNSSARQRLAAIKLSRGDYEAALEVIQPAWTPGAGDRRTRLIYSDALVANQQPEAAAAALSSAPAADAAASVTAAIERLAYQAYYRFTRFEQAPQAIAAWQTILLLEPGNLQAQQGLADAQQK